MSAIELEPLPGSMTARVFENRHVGIKRTLFFDIEIPLEPFELDGETQKTRVRLNFIRLPVSDWRDIQGQEYRFPVNPEEGYIDGSVYIGHVHNPADATCIRFGTIEGASIPAELEIRFQLEIEVPGDLGRAPVKWSVPLSIDPEELDKVVAKARRAGAIKAKPRS